MTKLKKLSPHILAFTALLFLAFLPVIGVYAQTPTFNSDLPSPNLDREGIYNLLIKIATIALMILPAVALLFIIWGAFKLITGDSEKGWSIIKNSLIGLVVAGLSFLVVGMTTNIVELIYSGEIFQF